MLQNWKTTLGGFITATGLAMQASDNPHVKLAGWLVAGLGATITGVYAKDKNVTGKS